MPDRVDPATEDVATALLMAAVTLRDLTSSMPRPLLASMPADIRNRMTDHRYQAAFDRLPEDVREKARAAVHADPDIIAARNIDRDGRHP